MSVNVRVNTCVQKVHVYVVLFLSEGWGVHCCPVLRVACGKNLSAEASAFDDYYQGGGDGADLQSECRQDLDPAQHPSNRGRKQFWSRHPGLPHF